MFFDVTFGIDISTWFQKINVSFFLSGFKYHVILQLCKYPKTLSTQLENNFARDPGVLKKYAALDRILLPCLLKGSMTWQ
jgi:hypothetical protein